MADPIKLPKQLRAQGWKVKVYDNERLEPPHLTVICRERVWRIGLREKDIMTPADGRWQDIDPRVKAILDHQWETLCDAWDKKHPTNPVSSEEDEDDGN